VVGSLVSGRLVRRGTMSGARVRAFVGAVAVVGCLFVAMPAWAAYSAYVTDSSGGSVSEFGIAAGGVLSPSTGAPTVPAGSDPYYVELSADGKNAYVPAYSSGEVFQYGVGAGGGLSALSPADVAAGSGAYPLAASPDGKYVYVANANDNTVSEYTVGADGALSPATGAPTVATGSDPYDIVVTPDSKHVYVANANDNTVSEYTVGAGGALSPATGAPTVATGSDPSRMALSPDGKYLYVTNQHDDTVSQYTVGAGGALSPATGAPTVATGSDPFWIAMTPDGNYVYVTNSSDDTVSEYSVGAGGALSPATGAPTVATGSDPVGIAVSPDGNYVYVANADDTVSEYTVGSGGALSPATDAPTVAAGSGPYGIVVTPDSGPSASFTDAPATAGEATSFSAQGSDADESITGYAWNFGDGQTASGRDVTHTYAHPGSYTVTLTETDSAGCSAYGLFAGNAGGFTGHTPYCALDPAAQVTNTVVVGTTATVTVTRATVDDQQITLTSPSTCTASTGKLTATLNSTKIANSKAAKLKFSKVAFYVDKGVQHKRHKTVRTHSGKNKKVLVISYTANATRDHVPVTVELSLTGLKPGTHTLKVVVTYKETKRKHGHQKTITITKTLRVKFTVC
jgi:DNA-binding beta-propeller fold protein YncE